MLVFDGGGHAIGAYIKRMQCRERERERERDI
jgi:hypothetical protein